MTKLMRNKFLAAVAVGAALTFAAPSYAAAVNTDLSVNVTLQQNTIDWTGENGGNITAVGVGIPKGQGYALARVAAMTDAQRNLLGIINGVNIDADTLIQDLMVQNDTIKRNIGGVLKGAVVVDEGVNPDGNYFVRMSVPLYGSGSGPQSSVAAAVLPTAFQNIVPQPLPQVNETLTQLPKQEIKIARSSGYTGVVIDASGMGLKTTFSPVIYDTNGRAIYGASNINPDLAISKGMVGYSSSLEKATSSSRAGSNPLVIKAVSLRGGASATNMVNVVVSVEDGDRILLANESSRMLDNCAVVFVR